jgi:hypothetical protein
MHACMPEWIVVAVEVHDHPAVARTLALVKHNALGQLEVQTLVAAAAALCTRTLLWPSWQP